MRSKLSQNTFKLVRYLKQLSFLVLILGFFLSASAQKKDSTYVGEVVGTVRDSVHNLVLRSATLSIYKAENAQLLSYQLSNNFGKFLFKEIPVGIKLHIIMSYVGYKAYKQEFFIPKEAPKIDLKNLIVERAENNLKEVEISAKPPVQMNGDTLEFNADAFKLDTNAVVEDFLRKLPGVTIWSDGVITVNGQKVSNVLVDGKPFFGGATKIATQNLPKNVVEKIQVYKDKGVPGEDDERDPQTNLNIVLKKDKRSGIFGKVGGGYGTDKRFAMDGMLSAYGPKTQVSLVGSRNNVNKSAPDVSTLIQYSSFKGEGIDVDYHSDFRMRGLNIFSSAGFKLAHEFNKDNKLGSDYLFSNSQKKVLERVEKVDNLNSGNQLFQNLSGTSTNNDYGHKFNTYYYLTEEHKNLSALYGFQTGNKNSVNTQVAESVNTGTGIESINRARQENSGTYTSMDVDLKLVNKRYVEKNHSKSLSFDIQYILSNAEGSNFSKRTTDFSSTESSQNQYFNRQYDTDYHNIKHTVNFNLPDVKGLLKWYTQFLNVNFKNSFSAYNAKEKSLVGDFTQTGEYVNNDYLTNKSNYKFITEKPALEFSKSFVKALVNRYSNSIDFSLRLQGELYNQNNISDKQFQKINRNYVRFIPEATIGFQNQQIGHYESTYSLRYIKSMNYANVYQIAPLVDSSNIYYRHMGNQNLKPAVKHELSLGVEHSINGSKNSGNGNFVINTGIIRNFIGDSSNYDALGRNIHYNVNVSGNKYIGYSGFLYKVYKLKQNQLMLILQSSLNYAHNPGYVNGQSILSKDLSSNHNLSISYSYRSLITFGGGQSLNTYAVRRTNSNPSSFRNFSTSARGVVNWPKNVYWSTHINYNRIASTYASDDNFTIWNADVVYRFLKGNNAEVKFSVLDLLRQNTSISNYGDSNSITRSTVNVLQQYFMFSIAYYPRKFGNTEKKKP